jgi:hypothetical protein
VCGTERLEAVPGQPVRLPRGVPHRWWNGGDQPLAFESRVLPLVDLHRLLHAMFEVVNAGLPNRLAGESGEVHRGARYRQLR